jgi:hypothetical protein
MVKLSRTNCGAPRALRFGKLIAGNSIPLSVTVISVTRGVFASWNAGKVSCPFRFTANSQSPLPGEYDRFYSDICL